MTDAAGAADLRRLIGRRLLELDSLTLLYVLETAEATWIGVRGLRPEDVVWYELAVRPVSRPPLMRGRSDGDDED